MNTTGPREREIDLRFFSPWEFGDWWPFTSLRLLFLLDAFRTLWGGAVVIRYKWDGPNVAGRLGRHLGPDDESDHNVDRWGEIRGVDLFPDGMATRAKMDSAVLKAVQLGFTAVGVYPHTAPTPMLHLGVRKGRNVGQPALWGAVRDSPGDPGAKQQYVSLEEALSQAEKGGSGG